MPVLTSVSMHVQVAAVFGDKDTSALTVTSLKRGSLVYTFTNNTLAGAGCPVADVTAMADRLVTADGTLTPEAVQTLKPWVLSGAASAPAGACEGNPAFPTRSASSKPTQPPQPDQTKTTTTTTPAAAPNVTGVASAGKGSGDDMWITTVVPVAVIVAIVLLAVLVACLLYRKKRKGKMKMEEQSTFVNKGAPVIFPDELDDKPSDSSKPLLMEGSPPAAPPDYQLAGPNSHQPDMAPHDSHAPPPAGVLDADIEVDASSPLYQPPPPVAAPSGKQARPHVQQPYRAQPPEIHP